MNDSASTPKHKTPKGSASKLAERAEKLKAELAATQTALREKEARKTALEKARAKKNRARALILMGLIYTNMIKKTVSQGRNTDPEKAEKALTTILHAAHDYFTSLPQETDKQKAKSQKDKQIVTNTINAILESMRQAPKRPQEP